MVVSAVDDRVDGHNHHYRKLVIIAYSVVNFTCHWINCFVVDLFPDNRTAITSTARVRSNLNHRKSRGISQPDRQKRTGLNLDLP
jgi:hypothetical protein